MIFNKIKKLHKNLVKKNKTLFLAESCTGGYFAKLLTDLPGSSVYFIGSIVCYSNEIKKNVLSVPEKTLAELGAVSKQTAKKMIEGLKKISNTDFQIAITGIAGPGGWTSEKPIGTVFIAVGWDKGIEIKHFVFKGNRQAVRKKTIIKAVDMLLTLLNSDVPLKSSS